MANQFIAAANIAFTKHADPEYLELRNELEGPLLGRGLENTEKLALLEVLHGRDKTTNDKGKTFVFVVHGRSKLNWMQNCAYKKEYSMMTEEECSSIMSTFEKRVLGPAGSTIWRLSSLVGVLSYATGDEYCSLLGSDAEGCTTTIQGALRGLPFIPKDYFHPLTKKPLLKVLERMVEGEIRNVKSTGEAAPLALGLGALNKFVLFNDNGKDLAMIADTVS
jgi:hypothetical protein